MRRTILTTLILTAFTSAASAASPETSDSLGGPHASIAYERQSGEIDQLFLKIVVATGEVLKAEPRQASAKTNELLRLKTLWLNQVAVLLAAFPAEKVAQKRSLLQMMEVLGVTSPEIERQFSRSQETRNSPPLAALETTSIDVQYLPAVKAFKITDLRAQKYWVLSSRALAWTGIQGETFALK